MSLAGTVLERDGATYRVATPDGEIRAVLRGRFTPRGTDVHGAAEPSAS